MHGSGIATQTAAGMLRKYATVAADIGCSQKQVEHIHFTITQLEKDFIALRAERDAAKKLCETYEEMLRMTPEERDLFTKPQWRAS